MKRALWVLLLLMVPRGAAAQASTPTPAAVPPVGQPSAAVASPDAAPAPAPAATPAPAPSPPKRDRPEFLLAALANRRSLFGIPFWGLGGTFGLSLRPSENFALDILAEHVRGGSDLGLDAHVSRLRVPMSALLVPWLRMGGSAGLTYMGIERATRASSSILRLGLSIGLHASADVVSSDDVALFVQLRGEIDAMWGNAIMPGGTLAIGLRL